ncbi:MAG: flagellar protein export ATPase FliI [Deferribacteraceae bacterium]|jgi:flagellum-specific ATP synthase|nr:flagellar protein export ATPase FliI [Deferribacteraceae bacterium]
MNNLQFLKTITPHKELTYSGHITKIVGMTIEANGPLLGIGSRCAITTINGGKIPAEIVGFKENRIILMLYGESDMIAPGSEVTSIKNSIDINVSEAMLGRILDGLGEPIDNNGPLPKGDPAPIYAASPDPMGRKVIKDVITTGIKAIDGLMTTGTGQRVGIFAGSGVGKSVLLGMIARNTNADINVIALIGERGREVREFIERDLGQEGLKRSVLVVATGDKAPLVRRMGAFLATAIAEYFRDQGKQVMFMMDSVTRFAMAQREIGLAMGEPPATKGYTPSTFSLLPKLLERAGTCSGEGSITGLYTVLVEGDDMNDPIADTVRSIIDGHIVLNRMLAARNHFPAIDVLSSASRLMKEIVSDETFSLAGNFRDLLATYREAEDLVNIGAYVAGSNPKIDESLKKINAINAFLQQKMSENFSYNDTVQMISSIVLAR